MGSQLPVPASEIVIRPRLDAELPGDDASRSPTKDSRAGPARSSPRRRLRSATKSGPVQPLREQARARPSCQITFNRSPRRPRKQNRWPPNGSSAAPPEPAATGWRTLCADPCARSPATPNARRDRNHRRSRTSRTRAKATASTPAPTITRRPRPSTISIRSSPDLAQPNPCSASRRWRLGTIQPERSRHWCRLGSLTRSVRCQARS